MIHTLIMTHIFRIPANIKRRGSIQLLGGKGKPKIIKSPQINSKWMILKTEGHFSFSIYCVQISFAKYHLINNHEVNQVRTVLPILHMRKQNQKGKMIFQSHRTNKYKLDQKSSLLTSSPKLLTLFFIMLFIGATMGSENFIYLLKGVK